MSLSVTQLLRVEHARLRTLMDAASGTADSSEESSGHALAELADRTLQIIYEELLPQLEAEQATLYPELEALTATSVPGDLLTVENLTIGGLARRLLRARARLGATEAGESERSDLRSVLHDIQFAVRSHLDKEDEVLLPLLEHHLGRRQDRELAGDLRNANEEARRAPVLL